MSKTAGNFSRRELVGLASLGAALSMLPKAFASTNIRLVMVHGIAQQGLNPDTLKAAWLDALALGAKSIGQALPSSLEVAFPYYADILDKFVKDFDIPLVQDVHAKGGPIEDDFLVFQAQVAESVRLRAGVTDEQIDVEYGANPKPKGPLNWEWVQAILRALDKHGGGMGQTALQTFTRDVFLYTTRAGVRDAIDAVVGAAISEQPTVVVGHSLGSVVAYNVLRSDRRQLQVPLYLTLGSPLGIRAVRDQLRPLRFPQPLKSWYNAFDTRDVVALYPLDKDNFPVTPAIENYSLVKNHTDNRHGVVGYLDDPEVTRKLLGALKS
jgi:hypothetical protein